MKKLLIILLLFVCYSAVSQQTVLLKSRKYSKIISLQVGLASIPILKNPESVIINYDADSVVISWIDKSIAEDGYILEESYGGGAFKVVDTLSENTEQTTYFCMQNTDVKYNVRPFYKTDTLSGTESNTVTTYLSSQIKLTSPTTIDVDRLYISSPVVVYWGDGDSTVVTANSAGLSHSYLSSGDYVLKFKYSSNITQLFLRSHSEIEQDLSKWVLPTGLINLYLNTCSNYGDITNWVLPSAMQQLLLYGNDLYASWTDLSFPSTLTQFRVQQNDLSGDITSWNIPSSVSQFTIYDNEFKGIAPAITSNTLSYQLQYNDTIDSVRFNSVSTTITYLDISNLYLSTYNINYIFRQIKTYFETSTPTKNLTLKFEGTYNGYLTEIDALDSLETIFTNAGYTLTCTYNSNEFAFDKPYAVFSTDDGDYSNASTYYPTLYDYGHTMTIFVNPSSIGGGSSKLSWSDLNTLVDSGNIVGSHSYAHDRYTELSDLEIQEDIDRVDSAFVANGLDSAKYFAYPYGAFDSRTDAIVSVNYDLARTSNSGLNYLDTEQHELHNIRLDTRLNDSSNIDLIKWYIDKAIDKGAAIFFDGHGALPDSLMTPETEYVIQESFLIDILDYLDEKNIEVITLDELYNLYIP